MSKWHEDNRNLVSLAVWLNDECDAFSDVSGAIGFFENPWKWDREFGLWDAWVRERDPDLCQRFIEAVEGDATVNDVRAEWEDEQAAELSPEEIAEIKGDMEYHRRKDEGEL